MASPVTTSPAPAAAPPDPRSTQGVQLGTAVALALLGLFCGLSPLYDGLFDLGVWGPCALVVLTVLTAVAIGGLRPRGAPAWLAAGGLTALAGWAWLSTVWADAPGAAEVDGARYVLYAAALVLLVCLVRGRLAGAAVLGGATTGVLVVAVVVVGQMLFGDGPGLFIAGRLNDPLGYVNGEAVAFLLAFWPLIALAERVRQPFVAAPAAGLAAGLACLAVLSQSRGTALGALLGGLVVIALVPGRQPRIWLLLVIAAGIAVLGQPVLDLYGKADGNGALGADVVRSAGVATVVVAVVITALWAAAGAVLLAVGGQESARAATLRRAGAITLAVLALAAVVGGVALSSRISDKVSQQYDSFVNLGSDQGNGSRLTAGGGNRYDFWRVAVHEFSAHPLEGVGAGNYPAGYYRERRQNQDVGQPHSLPLQTLSELGIVGSALFVLFLVGVVLGLWRRARRATPATVPLVVAAGGAFLGWLGATAVDWVHLFPGLVGIALGAVAVLVDDDRPPAAGAAAAGAPVAATGRRRVGFTVAVVVLAACAAFGISRLALASHDANSARGKLATAPLAALADTSDALSLDGDRVDTYYVRSAAYARLGRYAEARGALREALLRDPDNFVTWTLIGDLAFRHGDRAVARASYKRAAQLNPLDAELQRLRRHPAG